MPLQFLDFVELVRPHLRAGLDTGQLTVGVLLISVLLGVCSFTDLFRDRRIPNVITHSLLLAGLAAAPLLFANPASALINAGVLGGLLFTMAITTSGVGMGDVKLYTALTLLLGPAGWLLYLVSIPIGLIYGLPFGQAQKRGRMRKFGVPMAPAIALAFPVTLAALGLSAGQATFLALVQAATLAVAVAADKLRRPLHERTIFYDDLFGEPELPELPEPAPADDDLHAPWPVPEYRPAGDPVAAAE